MSTSAPPVLAGIDHLVLVAHDVRTTLEFYERVLGAEVRDLDTWSVGSCEYPVLQFDGWKINVHAANSSVSPRALEPAPGSADLCLKWNGPISSAQAHLADNGVAVELGPIAQEGAAGWGRSVYFRDPDGCLLELISYEVAE